MRVLYFCIDNACRSQLAEALTNMLGTEGVEAYSAGAAPAATLDEKACDVMRELGYEMSGQYPKSIDDLPEIEFDYAVTLGCGDETPVVKARMMFDWDIPETRGMSVSDIRSVRDTIRDRVERLLVAPRSVGDKW